MKKYDRRRKYYMVLDCETATLPYAHNYDGDSRKKIAIAKPLIYDLGWQIIDRQGRVYSKKHFLISEVFSVPSIFNTAYYASKRPIYIDMLKKGEISITDWKTAAAEMIEDMKNCDAVGAYNSMFDFKKAIPFTELYINKLYSNDFYDWEKMQNHSCEKIVNNIKNKNKKEFNSDTFNFRKVDYPLFDIWGLSCKHLLNNDEYKDLCLKENWITASGKYFKTSAETAYRFATGNHDFNEQHTALDDATIESELLRLILKPKASNMEIGIIYFPFKILGTI